MNGHLSKKTASTWMWQSPKPKKGEPQPQHFDYLLVLDFEATCVPQGYVLKPQEIIEFPCALLNVKRGFQIEAIFHEYVRPIHNPKLTTFCTELTGITQDMVDSEDDFCFVLNKFVTWLEDRNLVPRNETDDNKKQLNTFTFITCGNWDLNYMLQNQCATSKIKVPKYFLQYINVKQSFAMASNGKFPRSLSQMLSELGLTFEGRQHSGIDDVKNIVKIVKKLAEEKCYIFENTRQVQIKI